MQSAIRGHGLIKNSSLLVFNYMYTLSEVEGCLLCAVQIGLSQLVNEVNGHTIKRCCSFTYPLVEITWRRQITKNLYYIRPNREAN